MLYEENQLCGRVPADNRPVIFASQATTSAKLMLIFFMKISKLTKLFKQVLSNGKTLAESGFSVS